MEVTGRALGIAKDYLEKNNIEIVEITFRRESQGLVLRILADKPEGITVSECEEFNNYLSEALDKEDVITEHYILEVASPGLDRHMKADRDFERAMGKYIEVATYERIDDAKSHEGTLVGMDKDKIVVEKAGISTVIPKDKIAMARLKIEF